MRLSGWPLASRASASQVQASPRVSVQQRAQLQKLRPEQLADAHVRVGELDGDAGLRDCRPAVRKYTFLRPVL